jgi:hypothetical protein
VKSLTKAIIVLLLHIAIVLSLGGKLLYDRAHRPRIWVRTGSVDPELPIRGRYLTLNVQVYAPEFKPPLQGKVEYGYMPVSLSVEGNRLLAHRADTNTGLDVEGLGQLPASHQPGMFYLSPSVAFFLPEHASVPRLKPGEEIWAEVTIPRKGPPRPIQLALKTPSEWKPLTYR